jgi:DNA-binding NtrC family response regulator
MHRSAKRRTTQLLPVRSTQSPLPAFLRLVQSGQEVTLQDGTLRIGTSSANDLILDDRYVSAFHCVLEKREGRLVLRDADSRNGTYVNGQRVTTFDVWPGTTITVGDTTLTALGPKFRKETLAVEQLLGNDSLFLGAIARATRAAKTTANVLIHGESGSGKELLARHVHESSPRAKGPFVALNCGAIARDLVQSELFGHEQGAYTGAAASRKGLFEEAHGGTLFLDEVGELPLAQQPNLLRVLETRRIRRVGGAGERELDVRVVAATHRDLAGAAAKGEFRLDLYHRLATVQLRIPPLRERPTDVPLLARHFLAEAAREHGPRTLSPEVLAALSRYSWPGNVRELKNAVLAATILTDDELHLGDLLGTSRSTALPPLFAADVSPPKDPFGQVLPPAIDDMTQDEVMKVMIQRAMQRCGSQRRAAAALKMAKSTLHEKVHRLGLVTKQ